MALTLKSYYAGSVEQAMAKARQELGPEAMLVHSRRNSDGSDHAGNYEVVFAVPGCLEPPGKTVPEASTPSLAALAAELSHLRRQVERLAELLARPVAVMPAELLREGEVCELVSSLMEQGVAAELAQDLAMASRARAVQDVDPQAASESKLSAVRLRRALAAELEQRLEVEPNLGAEPADGRRIVVLVGPAGGGKTTTLVKLAASYGLNCRRPAQILSVDTERVAGSEQLRSFSAILGLPFQAIESATLLGPALEEHRRKELVMIDTPGYSPRDIASAHEIAAVLARYPDVDTHLVLSAGMKSSDLSCAVERFGVFKPGKLIFTKLDETASAGAILNETLRAKRPVSFLCAGQRIPEDLEPASKSRLMDLVFRADGVKATAARA